MEVDEISEDQALNDVIYKKMKTQLAKDFSGKTIVMADGKFLGPEDSLENAWALASNYNTALVTRIEKKHKQAKILGSFLRILSTDVTVGRRQLAQRLMRMRTDLDT